MYTGVFNLNYMTNQIQNKNYYQTHKAEILKRQKEYYLNNKEARKAYQKNRDTKIKDELKKYKHQYYLDNIETFRLYWKKADLKRKFKITIEEYVLMFEKQNGCCKICGTHQSKLKRALAVDHNHNTNEIRGLLCDTCNKGLGMFHDDINHLLNAIEYLKNNN